MYNLSSYNASHGWMFWTRFLFMMDLMVEHASKRIQFLLIMLVVGTYLLVWVLVNPTYSDCDLSRVLDADDGQFTA